MNPQDFEEHGAELLHYTTSYITTIRSRRALPDVQPGFMRDLIPSRAPETPDKWEDVFRDIERVIMPGVTHWHSPNFYAYFRAAQSYPSMLADMLCNAIGCIGITWASCPSCTELEVLMMDWLGQMLNLPDSFLFSGPGNGGGVIQGTVCEATLMCLLSARTLFFRKERERNPDITMGQLIDKLVAYCSDQTHATVERAGLMGAVYMRKLETDSQGALRGPTLRAAILEDKAKGLLPFFFCATLGTTTSCAFDNLKELGPVCQEHGVWMHIDAAYAGSAFICPEFRPLLDGVEHAMSFSFNPHKWLNVMFDCSALWVQNTDHLRYAFDVDPHYLKHENQGIMPDFGYWQIPMGRRFRSLKIWFVLRLYGQKQLQEIIRKDVRLAHEFEGMVRSDDRFEIAAEVVLGLVCFRLKDVKLPWTPQKPDWPSFFRLFDSIAFISELGDNELSERLLRDINADGRIHLISSKIKGNFILRLAICGHDTQTSDVKHAWDVIRQLADAIVKNPGKK